MKRKRYSKKASRLLIMAMSAAFCVLLIGCGTSVSVIEQSEAVRLLTGDDFTAEVDGYFFSDDVVKNIMEIKVD